MRTARLAYSVVVRKMVLPEVPVTSERTAAALNGNSNFQANYRKYGSGAKGCV